MSSCVPCAYRCPQKPEQTIGSPVTGVRGGCKAPNMMQDLNPGPLQNQPVLLNTEPSL